LFLTRSTPFRFSAFTLFYFAQGVPIGLLTIAMPAWLAAEGVETALIATFAAITGLPWGLKLISGPFMDRFSFPAMGRRRPWVMAAQAGLTLAMFSMAWVLNPAENIWTLIIIGTVVNTFAALQDVAVDGMAIDILPEGERGRANAFMAFGQATGFSLFGALNGYLLVQFGLAVTALISTATVGSIFLFVTLVREREGERLLPWTEGVATPRAFPVSESFLGIFRDLIRVLFLPMSLLLISVEFMHRMSAGIAISIFPVMAVQELGFTSDVYSYWMGIMSGLSALAGLAFGPFIDRLGAKRFIMGGLLLAATVYASFAMAQAYWGSTPFVLAGLIGSQLAAQLIFVAVIAGFMGLCAKGVGATQFAVYMSLANLARSVGAGAFAFIAADVTSAEALYIMAALNVLAAILLTQFSLRKHRTRLEEIEGQAPTREAAVSTG
jgi:PAT family beta-lactamase induction signal transducer AmpG